MAEIKNQDLEAQKTRLVEDIPELANDKHPVLADLPADDFFDLLETSTIDELEGYIKSMDGDPVATDGSISLNQGALSPPDSKDLISTILWWELRRPLFNLIIGLCGLLTLIALSVLNNAPTAYLLFGAFTYFVTINVIYSGAWILELIVQLILGSQAKNFGPKLYNLGTVFTVLVTLAITVLLPITMLLTNPFG